MRLRSLFGSAFLVLAVLFAFTSFSAAHDPLPTDYGAYGSISDDGLPSMDLATANAVTPNEAQSVRLLPVADGTVSYNARVRSAYWPRERAAKPDTKGYSWIHQALVSRSSLKLA